jgi:hypothetical protein
MVALAVGGIVLLGARTLLWQVADGAERIAESAYALDREANADWVLRSAVASLDVPGDDGPALRGTQRGARFRTWCTSAEGWLEPCEATLGLVRPAGTNVLVLEMGGQPPIPLRSGFRSGRLLYLVRSGEGGVWVQEWSSEASIPLAVGVVLDADTLILRIGERG